jgi:NADH dehydrogenase
MQKIIIIGAGFAGLSSAIFLAKKHFNSEIIVIDRKETFDFLPLLPDTIGRGLEFSLLTFKIEHIAKRKGFLFLNEEVTSIDLAAKLVHTPKRNLVYDYLIIASGSETNFYGNDDIKNSAYTLDNVRDAARIISALADKSFDNYLIAGGGYTGIEAATNIQKYLAKRKIKARVIIIEKAASILANLKLQAKEYVLENLEKLHIEVFANTSIRKIEGKKVELSDSQAFDNAMIIWTAGVRTADFIQNIKTEKNQQGRLKIDEYLRINDSCFVAGDAAYFKYKESYLRMAVQFAITQGRCTAHNVLRSIQGKKLCKYSPLDLGYIIPMANNKSYGEVFGLNLKGRLPTLLHFLMCIYRSYGVRNRVGILKQLLGYQMSEVR